MKNKIIYLFCICFFVVFQGNTQNRKLEKAKYNFENFNFNKAIVQYKNLVAKGYITPEVYRNLGDAYYHSANYEKAAKWYEQLSNLDTAYLDKERTYRFAQSLRSIKNYKASDKLLKQLHALKHNDKQRSDFNIDYLKMIKEQSGNYSINNIELNSSASDFAPSFFKEEIVFSTARDTNIIARIIHDWNKNYFLDLYIATTMADGSLKSPLKFSKHLNTKLHESSTAFTSDGKTVYFTRNNENRRRFARGKDGISRLKIYKATLQNGKWKNSTPLPFNNDAYSVAHPTLNHLEDKLYFSSDMPGSFGYSDIFVVDINKDGSYGVPKNLGSKINTENKESFPFITDDKILYFSSDGHPGLGGLDIFAADLKDLENSLIVNIGEPINSSSDDFSLIINESTKKGFFASNRPEGKGSDDIYALTEITPLNFKGFKDINGIVKNQVTGLIVAQAKIQIYDHKNQVLAETMSNADGTFTLQVRDTKKALKVMVLKDDYEKVIIHLKNNAEINNLEFSIKEKDIGAPIGADLAKYLKIAPIYFNLNKWSIREDAKNSINNIIAYLNKYPKAKIQIGSHTDARASKAYNMRLSDKRANTTMEYLIDHGIDASRLRALGFGETMISNECFDHVRCDEHKHQENRRSEFIVIE